MIRSTSRPNPFLRPIGATDDSVSRLLMDMAARQQPPRLNNTLSVISPPSDDPNVGILGSLPFGDFNAGILGSLSPAVPWPNGTDLEINPGIGGGGQTGTETASSSDDSDKPPGVDWSFIRNGEGGRRTNGYMPEGGHSGVTIASGFDLGQRRLSDLQALGFDQDLINLLSPYLGRRGSGAKAYLARHPLEISDAQAEQIDSAYANHLYKRVAARYNREFAAVAAAQGVPPPTGRFEKLPKAAQTAIMDLAYQYGDGLPA